MNFTTNDLQTILYSLEGYMQGNDDNELVEELNTICNKIVNELEGESNNEIDKITDEFDKLERENDSLKSLLKEVN